MLLGAQMYTVRDYTKDLNSFSETLKKIAAIGYTDVQDVYKRQLPKASERRLV